MFTRLLPLLSVATLTTEFVCGAALSKAKRGLSPATVPIVEVELESNHPLARRQDNYAIYGGPAKGYGIQVNVGSSQTPLRLLLDTGSADLVLAPGVLPSDGSFTDTGNPCYETYGSGGRQQGEMYTGPFAVVGYQLDGYFCNLALGINGILGLTYPYPNGGGVSAQTGQNPLSYLQDAGMNSFGIYLSNSVGGGGAFTPNDYDPGFLADGAGFTSETVQKFGGGFWGLYMSGSFEYNGGSYDLGVGSAIIDTGTAGIVLPPSATQQIWQLTGADTSTGSYGSNCNPGGYPVTLITAGGDRYDIPAAVYVIQNGDGTCRSAFAQKTQQGTANNPNAIFGATFIRAYYTYFDIANGVMNFAPSGG